MAYPKTLLKDIYWSFSEGSISSADEFVKQMEEYHKAISGKKFPLKWNDVILDSPKLEIQYVKYIDDDIEEPYELLTSDNGKKFTVKELLYKTHQIVGIHLENDDNCYFEGLDYSGEENEGVPIYFLMTGS